MSGMRQTICLCPSEPMPRLFKKDEEDFERVRDFINSNPKATIEEVSEGTEVPVKKSWNT